MTTCLPITLNVSAVMTILVVFRNSSGVTFACDSLGSRLTRLNVLPSTISHVPWIALASGTTDASLGSWAFCGSPCCRRKLANCAVSLTISVSMMDRRFSWAIFFNCSSRRS